MTFRGLGDFDINVRVTIAARPEDALTFWTAAVENNSGKRITYLRFPLVKAVPAIGSPDDDFLVLPYLPGTLVENPAKHWPENFGAWLRYPGDLSAQFIAYQDRQAGVYLAGTDTQSHPKMLAVWKGKNGFNMGHDFSPPLDAGKQWEMPYAIALGVTQGTWCDSADIYKRWATKQYWCAKTLAQRDDIPQWWKDGWGVHVCEVRTYDDKRVCNGSYYPKMLEYLREWRRKTDGNIVAMLAGWENHRRWTAGDYFPIFDEANARNVIAQLKADGFRPFWFLSGMFYTFENEGVDGSQVPAATRFMPHYVVDQKTREPRVFTLNESGRQSTWKRLSYEFCVGAPAIKDFFRGVIDRARELGVDVLQMDQTTRGAGEACYSSEHDHTPGPGIYQTQRFQELLHDMRKHGKGRNPDFVLFHEEPHEALIQCLDGFHVREYKERWWYRLYPGAIGIPLFSYLYHEYAIGYGGDNAGLSKNNDRALVRNHAVNLVTGRTPGGSVWSTPQSMFEAHPDQVRMVRNHFRLLKTRATNFLMLGTMLHPYELAAPNLKFSVAVRRGNEWKKEEFDNPAILTSSWQAPNGDIAHLFVNISETRQDLKVNLDTRNAPAFGACNVEVYSSEQDAFTPLWKEVRLPRELSLPLGPLEVVFVEVRPSVRTIP